VPKRAAITTRFKPPRRGGSRRPKGLRAYTAAAGLFYLYSIPVPTKTYGGAI
jgi:hypothetical protein